MRTRILVLPAACLCGTVAMLFPGLPADAFDVSGEDLPVTQRDFRVFNNFADAASNNNTTPDPQFPGQTGAVLAIWKAAVEWGSTLHGDGSGDPLNNPLGSGGANFDFFFAGQASEAGGVDGKIVSALPTCGGGLLAFMEQPINDGWRMRFCDDYAFDDGPGGFGGSRYDIQSVAASVLGLCLGLLHSDVPHATMWPSVAERETKKRSLHPDDIAGIQAIYGVASPAKPRVIGTEPAAGSLTIHGAGFDATDNEIWFTQANPTPDGIDPIVRVAGVPSDGFVLTVAIPPEAGPGDVVVKLPGTAHATVSNAFPTDLVNDLGQVEPGPYLTAVTPGTVPALIPGTDQTVVLSGIHMDLAVEVRIDGVPVDPARTTIVGADTITLDLPQLSTAGAHVIEVAGASTVSQLPIQVVPPLVPVLELASGDPLSPVSAAAGLRVRLAGPVGAQLVLRASPDGPPSLERFLARAPGFPDATLRNGLAVTIPSAGWIERTISVLPDPGPAGMDWFGLAFRLDAGRPFPESNAQSIHLVP